MKLHRRLSAACLPVPLAWLFIALLGVETARADTCTEAEINVNWQWNVNCWEETLACPSSPKDSLYWFYRGAGSSSLDYLMYGQRHNPHAQQTYRDCTQQIGLDRFMLLVAGAADRSCDLGEADANIRWENDNNRQAILYSRGAWTTSGGQRNLNATAQAGGMYQLMYGQRHNADVRKLYRACFKSNADELFQLVVRYATRQNPIALLTSAFDGTIWTVSGPNKTEVRWFDGVQWRTVTQLPSSAQSIAIDSQARPWAVLKDGSAVYWVGSGWDTKLSQDRQLSQVAADREGSVWFVDQAGKRLLQYRPGDNSFMDKPLPENSSVVKNLFSIGGVPSVVLADGSARSWSGTKWTNSPSIDFERGAVLSGSDQLSALSKLMPDRHAKLLAGLSQPQTVSTFSMGNGEIWGLTTDQRLFRSKGSAAAFVVPGDDVDTAWVNISWAWNDDGPCTNFLLCWTYIDSVGIKFSDGTIGPFANIYRDGKSAHSCIASALDALKSGDRGLAVEWVMASQIHNRPVFDWLKNHPDAVIDALGRLR